MVVGVTRAGAAARTSRAGRATLPDGVTWPHIAGVGLLAGVGFTMSLFVSELAFGPGALLDAAKLGILIASLTAGVCGYLILRAVLSLGPGRAGAR